MLTLEQAQQRILAEISVVGRESAAILEARGRVASQSPAPGSRVTIGSVVLLR